MISYRVYLIDMKNDETEYKFENKEEVKKCINDANKAGFFGFRIIITIDGSDIPIRGRFNNKDENVEIPKLDYEWRVLENGFIQNYTKYREFQEEEAKRNATQGRDESGEARRRATQGRDER